MRSGWMSGQFNMKAYGGWVRNPAPVENGGKHPIIGFQPSKVMQGFFHPQLFRPEDQFFMPHGTRQPVEAALD